MKTKLLRVLLVSGALLFMAGCASKAPPPPTDTNTAFPTGDAEQSSSAQAGDTGKVTDELWVEMAAQDIYHSETDPAAWGAGGGRDRMFQANGVTWAQLEAYGAKQNSDPKHAQELFVKLADRVTELEQKK